tara:strand:+ start:241 stop:1278 length:1038 start_codon:yes stop_codon:yes gene_type:complete
MAYQNVGTPRFYVSVLQWLKSLGKLEASSTTDSITDKSKLSLVDINPTSQATFTGGAGYEFEIFYKLLEGTYDEIMPNDKNFLMLLGHTFKGISAYGRMGGEQYNSVAAQYDSSINLSPIIRNGYTIGLGNDAHDIITDLFGLFIGYLTEGETYKIGSVLYGTYYDMPHSPDLNLTMTREYGGVKTIETKGGASLSNSFYRGSPAWGDAGAWELYKEDELGMAGTNLVRSGRRVWDLSFSHLDSSDVFGSNQLMDAHYTYTAEGYDSEDIETGQPYFRYNLLTDDNFFSQVIHKTQGQLPFIFQPDKDNNNPDQFAICKLDMKSFKFSQKSFNTYNISLKIREVW